MRRGGGGCVGGSGVLLCCVSAGAVRLGGVGVVVCGAVVLYVGCLFLVGCGLFWVVGLICGCFFLVASC